MKILIFIDHSIMVRHFLNNNAFGLLSEKYDVSFALPFGHKRVRALKIDPSEIDNSKYITGNDVVIITNRVLAKLHLDKLKKSFKKFNLNTFVLPDGEKYKDINSFTKIHDFLIKNKVLKMMVLGNLEFQNFVN